MTLRNQMLCLSTSICLFVATDVASETIRYHCVGDHPELPEYVIFTLNDRTLDFELLEYPPAGLDNSDKIVGPFVEGGGIDFTIEFYAEGSVYRRESHSVDFETLSYFSALDFYSEDGSLAAHGPLSEGQCSAKRLN